MFIPDPFKKEIVFSIKAISTWYKESPASMPTEAYVSHVYLTHLSHTMSTHPL